MKGNFIVTWTPFAFVSMWSAFVNPDTISPELSMVTSILTKSSFFWTPLVYILSDKRVKEYMLKALKCKKNRTKRNKKEETNLSIQLSNIKKCNLIDPRFLF